MYILDTDRLKELINDAGLSQRELAEKTHTTPCAISRYISGKRTPRLNELCKICEVLQCNVSDMIMRI